MRKKGVFSFSRAAIRFLISFVVLFVLNFLTLGIIGYLLLFPILPFCGDHNSFCYTCEGPTCWAAILIYGSFAVLIWSFVANFGWEFFRSWRSKKKTNSRRRK